MIGDELELQGARIFTHTQVRLFLVLDFPLLAYKLA